MNTVSNAQGFEIGWRHQSAYLEESSDEQKNLVCQLLRLFSQVM